MIFMYATTDYRCPEVMHHLGLFATDLQVDLWDLNPGPFRTKHTEVQCMNNCTAAIGEPVRLLLVTKDTFQNKRRESCVKTHVRDSCSLNATLILDSADGTESTIWTEPGQSVWKEQKISIEDTKDGKFTVDVTQQVKTTAKLKITARSMLGKSNESFAEIVELDFVAKDCEDKQCLKTCSLASDPPTCIKEKCETREVGADGNCQCRPNYGLKKGWMKGKATDGTDCYMGNSTQSAKEGCCQICPGGTSQSRAGLEECQECPDYQTSKEGSTCTSCTLGQVWNKMWPPDAKDNLKKDFPKGRYCQTCDRGTYTLTNTATCGNANTTDQDQCNSCKNCPEGACCPVREVVPIYEIIKIKLLIVR